MSDLFSSSYYLCLLLVLALFQPCISDQKIYDDHVLCMEGERQALLEFKLGIVDKTDRLASWVRDHDSNCCKWSGIVCDNITGHVIGIHLDGQCNDFYGKKDPTRQLGGNISSSLLHLKQLRHLDLSCNKFRWIQIPKFIGSLRSLRYLNLSVSEFSGIIPHELGNLSRLHVLSLGSFLEQDEDTHMMNMQWLSRLGMLHHLDMSGVDLSQADDWFQVINTLSSLTELHLSNCGLLDVHPHVPSFNITSLSLLDLSSNDFSTFVPQWIFGITNLVSLDLSWCHFHSLIHANIDSFRNLTSLKSLHVSSNDFMDSSSVLKGLSSTVASNLVSLKMISCGVSSSVLNSLNNLTSLLRLDLSQNKLTKKIPTSFVNSCNLREIDLSRNEFGNISLTHLLESFLECESISSLETLYLSDNHISGPIPHWIGQFSSLEELDLSDNRLDGSLPDGIGYLYKLKYLSFSKNLLTGIVTEDHFAKLASLKFLIGGANNLTLRPRLANWIPPLQLWYLDLSSWSLGPQFPFWVQSQTDLENLSIRNTGISSAMPASFWKSFPNLKNLDMSQNNIRGTLLGIPATVSVLDLNSNEFIGELPTLSYSSNLQVLDLSNNLFVGSLDHFLCSVSVNKYISTLNLGTNHLSGVIPDCWDKWSRLMYLNLEDNNFSGEIPRTLGSLIYLRLLSLHRNKLSGRIPASLMKLKNLALLQLGGNELVGSIPTWFDSLSYLRLLNLRSNNFDGNIPFELCHLIYIQILDLAHNNLSGNIPTCFNNFSVLSGRNDLLDYQILFYSIAFKMVGGSDSLVMKGREDTYNSILGLVTLLDLSSNNLVGHIPSELTALNVLKSLNLSRNQLTRSIPEKIGNLTSLETLDLSLNKLSGELPTSLSRLTFLLSFNVSFNFLTGRVPSSTQLQSFDESSFFGNKLCGDPVSNRCVKPEVPNAEKKDDVSHEADWGFITSIVLGLVTGFWLIVAPLIVSRAWRIAYFLFLSDLRSVVYDVMHKYGVNMFSK